MRKLLLISLIAMTAVSSFGQKSFERDTIETINGNLVITFIGHGSLLFTFMEKNFYIDPVGQVADFANFPKADAILVTHEHGDHLDPAAIGKISKPGTEVFLTELCLPKYPSGKVIKNDAFFFAAGVPVNAVAAYNIQSLRGNGKPYHPKGEGNGYILTFGKTKVYVAGDTEMTPEMAKLTNLDIIFLAVAEPYTMPVGMAVDAVLVLKPKIFYPYHLNNTNPDDIIKGLMGTPVDIRIRSLK